MLPSPRSPWTTWSANFFVAKREKRGVAQIGSNDEPRRKGNNRIKATLSGPRPKTVENRSPTQKQRQTKLVHTSRLGHIKVLCHHKKKETPQDKKRRNHKRKKRRRSPPTLLRLTIQLTGLFANTLVTRW